MACLTRRSAITSTGRHHPPPRAIAVTGPTVASGTCSIRSPQVKAGIPRPRPRPLHPPRTTKELPEQELPSLPSCQRGMAPREHRPASFDGPGVWPSLQPPARPARGRPVGREGQQDPRVSRQGPQMLIVVRYGQPVLFPDSAEAGQLGGEILADLCGGREHNGKDADRIIDEQLGSRVPAEDRVLHAVSCSRDVEALAIPREPVGAQVRTPVAADPGNDDVTRLSQERLDLVGGCHPLTLPGPSARPEGRRGPDEAGTGWAKPCRRA